MRCPRVLGRERELTRLRERVAGSPGGVTVLVGDAGVGKSRLLDEVTRTGGLTVLGGRAVPADRPVPYRPLTEAFLGAFRGRPVPDRPLLRGFEGHLGRLVPVWRSAEPADESPVLLAEAAARLLTVVGEEGGVVLTLEDLHWADAETTAVVEYLADALPHTPARCVVTARADESTRELVDRLARRDPASVIRLDALDDDAIAAMVAACLETGRAPAGLVDFVRQHTDGNPLLVEELLAGVIATGSLRRDGRHWEVIGRLTVDVPANLRESVARRLALLDPSHRRVIGAAALLGRTFSWELLPGIADVDGRTAAEALRAAVDEQLLEATGDEFSFRHALSREAVVADLIPPERRELASRAWPVIELAHPGLPGPMCELAADLAQAAGDSGEASRLFVESARRAIAMGAFVTAEGTARRAHELAGRDQTARLAADEVLVQVLTASGKLREALTIGESLAERMSAAGVAEDRRAGLLVDLARAAIAGGDLAAATRTADAAASILPTDRDPVLSARVDIVLAELALERVALGEAEDRCRRAVEIVEPLDQPDALCDALILLGRVRRPSGHDTARPWFERAATVAERHGLDRWHLLARRELALLDMTFPSGADSMRRTRDLAVRYGALTTAAVMDLSIADLALGNYDRAEALTHAQACVDASARYGLATEPLAHLWLAGAHALASDESAMQDAIDAALARDPDDPRLLADLLGRVLLTRALVRDEIDDLPALLDPMMNHVRRAPSTKSVYPGRVVWALVHTIEDADLGAAARAEHRDAADRLPVPMFPLLADLVDAVAIGRTGEAQRAADAFDAALDGLRAYWAADGLRHTCQLLAAPAAIRDGWGTPTAWLRETEAWFAAGGYPNVVRRARRLLGEAGAPVPRRGRGQSDVPTALRAMGVTSREVDVLKLVIDGRSNREIADALFLSPKTVERHLSSLFARTGVRDRRALAALGVTHLS